MPTTVVNIRRTDNYDVYCGREGHGQNGKWGNPFKDENRERAIYLFRRYFYKRLRDDAKFKEEIQELRGKRLGCFCKPKSCHCDVIAEYLDRPMRVLVCGDRNWTDTIAIRKRLSDLPKDTEIVQGECDGADLLAREIAIDIGLDVIGFPANWKRHGKSAGPLRNIKMANTCPNLVIAFHNDLQSSKGTKHMVNEARRRGITVEVIQSEGI